MRIILLLTLVGSGTYIAQQNGVLPKFQKSALQEKLKEINPISKKKTEIEKSTQEVTNSFSIQAQQLTNRSKEVGEQVSHVLGTYIQPADGKNKESKDSDSNTKNEDGKNNPSEQSSSKSTETSKTESSSNQVNKPIYEETFDYGRYLYCQQVVKDYETRH